MTSTSDVYDNDVYNDKLDASNTKPGFLPRLRLLIHQHPWLLPTVLFSILVLLLWLPVGFYTTGLVEEWQFYDLASQGVPLVPSSNWNIDHTLRPFVALAWQVGYWLTPNSFLGLNLVMMAIFIGKALSFYALVRLLLPNLGHLFALFGAALFILYPADAMTMMLRGISIHFALFLCVLAAVLLILYWRRPRRYLMLLIWVSLAITLGIYELSYIFVFLTPLLLLYQERRISRRVITTSFLWYLPFFVYVVWYGAAFLSRRGSSYQSFHLNQAINGGPLQLINQFLESIVHLFNWNFAAGWTRALAGFRFDPFVILIAVVVGVAFAIAGWLLIPRDQQPSRPMSLKQNLLLLGVGLLVMIAGYLPYSILGSFHLVTERVFYFTSVGATVFVLGVIYLLTARLRYRYVAFILLASTLVGIATAGAIVQHLHYRNWSREQQRLYAAIVETMPEISDDTRLIVYQDQNPPALSSFPNYPVTLFPGADWLNSAVRYIYQNSTIELTFCDAYSFLFDPEYCDEKLSEVPADQLIVMEYQPVSGKVVVLDQIPKKYSAIQLPEQYDPYQRFDPDAPEPEYAQTVLTQCYPLHTCMEPEVDRIFDDFSNPIHSVSWLSTYLNQAGITTEWSLVKDAVLSFPPLTSQNYRVSFRVIDTPTPENWTHLKLSVNTHDLPLTARMEPGSYIYEGIVPEQLLQSSSTDLVFSVDTLKSVGGSPALGIAVDWLRIEPMELPSTVHLEFDQTILNAGWRVPEVQPNGTTFQWMTDNEASVYTLLNPDYDYHLSVRSAGALDPEFLERFGITVNGHPVELVRQDDAAGLPVYSGIVNHQDLDQVFTEFTFQTHGVAIPEGGSQALSVALDWLDVEAIVPQSSTRFEFDGTALGSGWRATETGPDGATFQWMTAREAALGPLYLDNTQDYLLTVSVVNAADADTLDTLTVDVNGRPVELDQTRGANNTATYTATIPQALLTDSFTQIDFNIDELTVPDGGDQPLGLAFDQVRIEPVQP